MDIEHFLDKIREDKKGNVKSETKHDGHAHTLHIEKMVKHVEVHQKEILDEIKQTRDACNSLGNLLIQWLESQEKSKPEKKVCRTTSSRKKQKSS